MSHLNLTRLIIDNQEPGISQLGGVWLPLNHILPLVLIWNDAAWQSGFAGSAFSMISYVLSVVLIYKSVMLITGNKIGSIIGAAVFALNLNSLYLQSTPLTESLYLFFFIASVFFILKWILTHNEKYLPLIGFFGFLQVLTRYDGWFVTGLQVAILFFYEYIYSRKSFAESFSKILLVSVPIAFGVGSWLLWNLLIFGDPLFFALGPYSARAQQEVINHSTPLITKGNLEISAAAYYYAAINNVGLFIMALGIFGSLAFLFLRNNIKAFGVRGLIFLLFFTPVIFNIFALFLGFSILNVPELNWKPKNDESALWFNVRYGIMALPAIALFIGILASGSSIFKFGKKVFRFYPIALIAVMIISFQSFITYKEGVITIIDGTRGSSSYLNSDVSDFLKPRIGKEDKILLAVSYYNPVAFKSQADLKQLIHEGVSKDWQNALANPQNYADWIVMSNGKVGDPVYDHLVEKSNNYFLQFYQLEFKGNHASVYKRNNILAGD